MNKSTLTILTITIAAMTACANAKTTDTAAEGTLRLARSDNFLLATLTDDIINIANKDTTLTFFNVDEAYPAQLGERPSAVDMLKAVRPFVFDDVVRDATTPTLAERR